MGLVERLPGIAWYGIEGGPKATDARYELLTNQVLFIVVVASWFFAFFLLAWSFSFPITEYLAFQIGHAVTSTTVLALRPKLSRVTLLNFVFYHTLGSTIASSVMLGAAAGMQYAIFAFVVMPFFVFKYEEKSSIIAACIISSALLVGLHVWFQFYGPLVPVPPFVIAFVAPTVLGVILTAIVYLAFATWSGTQLAEEQLNFEKEKIRKLLLNIIPKIKHSNRRYRQLVESSKEIVFSLDKDLRFTAVNTAIRTHLEFGKYDIMGHSFLELVHPGRDGNLSIARDAVAEKMAELLADKGSVSIRTALTTQFSREPKEMSVRLEYTESEGNIEILGKASNVVDDVILEFLEHEKHTYMMDNYISNAELMSHRLTRNLSKHIDAQQLITVRVCLREILINAIEHGNLNIQFDEKTSAIQNDTYLEFIQERQRDSRYIDKKVKIEYFLTPEKVAYRVTDNGEGFDHARVTALVKGVVNQEELPHGRGLLMAYSEFDLVRYNATGNQVILVKYFD